MPKVRTRANGDGTIFERKWKKAGGKTASAWVAELVIGTDPETGKKQVLRTTADTRRECQTWLTKTMRERDTNTLVIPTKQTLQQFLRHWIDTTATHEVSASTVLLYENMLAWYIGPHLGHIALSALKPPEIQDMYHQLLEAGKSPRTVQLAHAVLRRGLRQAVEWGTLAKNPAESVRPPRLEHKEMQYLTPEQILAFLEAAKADRLHALFILAPLTGLRRGELLGLRWQDLDLEAGTLTVAQAQKKVGETFSFGATKTKSGRRTIDLPLLAIAALKRWRKEQEWEQNGVEKEWKQSGIDKVWEHPGLVFTSRIGTPVHPKNMLDRHFLPLLKRAGLPRIRFHDLRHSAATLMASQGVKDYVLQSVLGHAHINITKQLYTHVLESQKKEAATKVDDFLAAAKRKAR